VRNAWQLFVRLLLTLVFVGPFLRLPSAFRVPCIFQRRQQPSEPFPRPPSQAMGFYEARIDYYRPGCFACSNHLGPRVRRNLIRQPLKAELACSVFLPIYLKVIRSHPGSGTGAFNINGHLDVSTQIPGVIRTGQTGMVDPDTPQSAWTRASATDEKQTLQLVWSDEFNVEGRSFYPGDDPYWEAVDLYYWQTGTYIVLDLAASRVLTTHLSRRLGVVRSQGCHDEGRCTRDHAQHRIEPK
jgi:hypothetical protein